MFELGGEEMGSVSYKVYSTNCKEGNCRNESLKLGKSVWKQCNSPEGGSGAVNQCSGQDAGEERTCGY